VLAALAMKLLMVLTNGNARCSIKMPARESRYGTNLLSYLFCRMLRFPLNRETVQSEKGTVALFFCNARD
jgi:hypothetical protein